MRKRLNTEERVHGSASTYLKYKCRCEPCVAAVQEAYARKNAARNAKKAKARGAKLNAQPLIEFIGEAPPEIRDKYKDKFGGWATFGVDIWTADKICIDLSTHPVLVFGQVWIDKALEDEEVDDSELIGV
jgi:hypothetical protein